MGELSNKDRLELKELELNSLLEITQAINDNISEVSLYKIYEFTLRANLQIKKLALFVMDERWSCKVNYGTDLNCFKQALPQRFQDLKETTRLSDDDLFHEFDYVLPIHHKNHLLALVFVSDLGMDTSNEKSASKFLQALSNIILVAIENKKLSSCFDLSSCFGWGRSIFAPAVVEHELRFHEFFLDMVFI